MFELTDGRPAAFQWDTGLYVDCTGLSEEDEVHFSRPGITLAIHPGWVNGVLAAPVPDELLQCAAAIAVFAYVATPTGEMTRAESRLGVTGRPKPPTYAYTPAEVLSFRALEERVEALEAGGGSGGTANYNALQNRPSINGVVLAGNKTAEELGLAVPTVAEVTAAVLAALPTWEGGSY